MTPISWGGGAAGQPSCPTGGAWIPPPAAGGRQIHSYSYPPRGAGSGGCQARQEEGVRTPLGDPRPVPTHPCVEAERAVPEMASMSLNNWYKCSPKPDHFLLPPQRKQRWKEAQSQGGRDSTRRSLWQVGSLAAPVGSWLHGPECNSQTNRQSQAQPEGSVLRNIQTPGWVLHLPAPRNKRPPALCHWCLV